MVKSIDLSEKIELDKNKKHTIEVVVDRIVIKEDVQTRLADSLKQRLSWRRSESLSILWIKRSCCSAQNLACPECGFSVEELAPRMFSFNSPFGACPDCDGLGSQMIVDPDLLVPDTKLTIEEGAFEAWAGSTSNYYPQFLAAVCEHYEIPRNVPVSETNSDQMKSYLLWNRRREDSFPL